MPLDPDQIHWLDRLEIAQRWTGALGLVLAVLGLAYATWGVLRFDPALDPRADPGFDRPVARLAFLFDGTQVPLGRIRPETATERVLLDVLDGGMRFGAGMAVLLLRLLLGTLAAMAGFAMMTVVVERRRLLRIVDRLRRAPGPAP